MQGFVGCACARRYLRGFPPTYAGSLASGGVEDRAHFVLYASYGVTLGG